MFRFIAAFLTVFFLGVLTGCPPVENTGGLSDSSGNDPSGGHPSTGTVQESLTDDTCSFICLPPSEPTTGLDACGNAQLDGSEACDVNSFGELNSCQSLGFEGGELDCTLDCELDTSQCYYACGDAAINFSGGEDCDPNCPNTPWGVCTEKCHWMPQGICGDGKLQPQNMYGVQEQCDDGNGDETDYCLSNCQFNPAFSGPYCGNKVIDRGEECDDGPLNHLNGPCSPDCENVSLSCKVEYCGDLKLSPGEQCDGTEGCNEYCQLEGPLLASCQAFCENFYSCFPYDDPQTQEKELQECISDCNEPSGKLDCDLARQAYQACMAMKSCEELAEQGVPCEMEKMAAWEACWDLEK